jgi:nitrate reductase gamma subunit
MVLSLLQLSSYVAFAIFIVVTLRTARKWASMPMHLRWELYPVPHEPEHEHGSSYLEKVDWQTKPRETTLAGELKELLMEMLFIKRVFDHKRDLWWLTFPFHFGVYLILGWFALLFVGGLTQAYTGIAIPSAHPWAQLIHGLTLLTGSLGIILGTLGTLGLLVKRLFTRELREYSAGVEFLNLIFILVVFGLGAVAWLTFDTDFSTARAYMTSLVSFSSTGIENTVQSNSILLAHVILLELLFIYIPFTKMSHFVGKYFTYHTVLWEDEPNIRGGPLEKKIKDLLTYKVSWGAPHIKKGKNWVENATAEVEENWGEWKI